MHQKNQCNEKQALEIIRRFCRYMLLEHRRTNKLFCNWLSSCSGLKVLKKHILRAEGYTIWPAQVSPSPIIFLWRPDTTRVNGNFWEEIFYFHGAKHSFYNILLWLLCFNQGHLPGTLGLWKHLMFEELSGWQSKEIQIHDLHGIIFLLCRKVQICF